MVSNLPPSFNQAPVFSQVFEFKCTSNSVAQGVTFGQLRRLIFSAVSTTQGYSLFQNIKLNQVEMWSFGSSGSLTPAQISLEWGQNSSGGGPVVILSDYGNANNLGHIRARPPTKSFVSFWQNASTDSAVAFYLSCQVGDLVRVTVSFCFNQEAADAILTGTGSTTGSISYNYLCANFPSTSASAGTTSLYS